MGNIYSLQELKKEIEDKRIKLNKLVLADVDKEDILKFSNELDKLIDKYYIYELNKNRADD
ncbi:Spo0E like sporulation regulatory protein [Keratinibaculum paraultunense]|uniref:Spo0E like sporulation regulatory protein n=1 Tax=Keratinibaculum paraultunense TaxID=1278232 RepID=A0A4R3KYP1_9FIRM|nr:aspartyl-phosphate phosphatase Spo0E family protein [Keratinibaculum paraultunense]QQY80210.1 Spo0E family sporulation regulatory protein-aspartic acid phosphatase [Keratinibaculum paraultunense]TCS90721.1 Spo0E like sporulation regulatory protein [Keratinibaculum paraultunense]